MQPLILHLGQFNLVWENSQANLRYIGEQIAHTEGIVILPEMFATGFTMRPELFAQPMNGEAVSWMKEVSKNKVVCGSLSIAENGKYYNRFIWAENGEIKHIYNKRHLFSHGRENAHYTAGEERICIEYLGWKIQPFVCYDLRFPVWCRNTEQADVMLFVANWPQVRIKAWEKLLQARSIENQCYVAAVNRVGEDGHRIYHNGCSLVCDPWGEILVKKENTESLISLTLQADKLMEFRNQFPVLEDRDVFNINPN